MTVRERILRTAGLQQQQQPRGTDIVFQVVAWHALDVVPSAASEDGSSSDDGGHAQATKDAEYTINAFGVTATGRSVCVRIRGFPPFFYVKVPADIGRGPRRVAAVQALADTLAGHDMRLRVEAATPMRKRDFWGFNGGEMFDFIRLRFRTLRDMRIAASKISKRTAPVPVRGYGSARLVLYESNMDPLLRFLHVQQLVPAGWVNIAARAATRIGGYSTCDMTFDCAWKSVQPHPDPPPCIAPLVIAAFDIECASAHGDFPVAKKDYRRLAIDVVQAWERRSLRTAGEYVAATAIERVILEAFGIEPQGPDRVARLHIKGMGTSPLCDGDAADVRKLAKQYASDLVSILRGSSQQKQQQNQGTKSKGDDARSSGQWWATRRGGDEGGDGGDEGDEGDEGEEETTTLGVLTSTLNAAFERRWPLEGDAVIQIGMTVGIYGASACVAERHVLVLGTCDEVPGSEVRVFEREEDLLLAWVGLVREIDPDVLVGYNVFGFDMAYMHSRAQELFGQQECEDRFCRIGRLVGLPSAFVEQRLSSSAFGDNVLRYLDAHGRVSVDLMKVVQRDHRLDSYKLDNVAEHFLKTRKHDVSPQDIFRLQRGSSADRAVIAAYCVQDCELCNLLASKLETLANNVGMANVCWVPLSYIFMRGQGIKIFSLVAKRCREDGMLIPTRSKPAMGGAPVPDGEDEEGYEGAIVLEPKVGLYLDDPVTVLDYNSLYPSSMISHNISHDSLVIDARYMRLPGVEYVEVRYDRYEGKGDDRRVVGECTCRFARRGNADGPQDAVLPRILRDLLAHRKATRQRLAELTEGPEHDFQRSVLDGQQLAYKVTANSLYGQMGARTSPLYLKQVAACTTAVGRQMIMQAKAYVEEVAGGRVIYGDSVPGYTPITVRISDMMCDSWCCRMQSTTRVGVAVLQIEDLERFVDVRVGWHDCGGGKEAIELHEGAAEVLDFDGSWVPLLRIVRHRLSEDKRLVEARSARAIVHVTDEHSLLLADATPVAATDVRDGTELLHIRPGSLRVDWDDLHESMHGVREIMRPVFESFIASPEDIEVQISVRNGQDQLHAARFAFLASACAGLDDVELRVVSAQSGGEWLIVSVHKPCVERDAASPPDAAAFVRGLPPTCLRSSYVYDLTTSSHRFQAGVGSMVVHNTDSIFVVFDNGGLTGRDALASSIRQGQQVSSGIHPYLPQPHKLAYEKTLFPMGLLNKKRYFGLLYEDDPDDPKPKQKSMGIALKRRDYASIVKQLYGGVIDIILRDRDVPRAVEFLKRRLVDLAEGRYDLDDLVISKTLRSYYKMPHQIAHCVLARRMYDRDPGSAPQANDRVPYVFVETSKKNALMGDRIEHVDYVRASLEPGVNKPIRVDTKLYIQNQLQKPCVQLLAIALEQLPGYVPRPHLTGPLALDALVVQKQGNLRKARERLDAMREREVEALIFAPVLAREVFRERDNRCGGQMEITAFFGRSDTQPRRPV